MRTIETMRRSGIGIAPGQTVRDAAGLMEETGVGSLAVIDGGRLVGIVTDRDLVRRVLARGLGSEAPVVAVMSSPVVTIGAEADQHDAFALFRSHGVRRLAVLQDGEFVGMVTVDDLLVELAKDLGDLSRPVSAEIDAPHRDGSVPSIA